MEYRANNFSVYSKGYCFLCLDKIPPQFTPSLSVYSLHDISRYLEMDMRKVFIQGGPIPPQLLTKVEKSRLKVELCESCGDLTGNISKRCRELEKLKMEIEAGVKSIHVKMADAEKSGRTAGFKEAVGSPINSGMGDWIEILEVLRMEAIQKCSRKISTASPRLKIERSSKKEIKRKTFRIASIVHGSSHRRMSGSECEQISITKEESKDVDWAMEDDNHSENSFGVMDDSTTVDSNSKIIKAEEDNTLDKVAHVEWENMPTRTIMRGFLTTSMATQNDADKPKWTINPETGKYKCGLCPMELSQSGIQIHYKTVHRKIKFKCNICGKEFTQQGTYKVHHQSVHMGIRFQCQVCKKSFSQKNNLMAHMRKAGCAISMDVG